MRVSVRSSPVVVTTRSGSSSMIFRASIAMASKPSSRARWPALGRRRNPPNS
jgi:hypothetical protein